MTSAEHEPLQDLAPAYALGALSTEEARRFESFLAGSAETQLEVAEYRDVAALLALSPADAVPDERLRRRVLTRVGAQKTGMAARRRSPLVWAALAASLLAATGLGASLVATRDELGRLRAQLDHTSRTLAAREATLNAIFRPGVQMFQLTAKGDPDPGIQLFWDRIRSRAVLNAFRLRPVPAGQAYQLWFIRDGQPVPSITFRPEPTGDAQVEQVEIPGGGEVSAAAVTIEPEAGSAQPTSPIVLVGSLQRS